MAKPPSGSGGGPGGPGGPGAGGAGAGGGSGGPGGPSMQWGYCSLAIDAHLSQACPPGPPLKNPLIQEHWWRTGVPQVPWRQM